VHARERRHNAQIGDIVAVSDGQITVNVKGLQMSVIGDANDGEEENPHAAVELEWKEDVNLMNVASLIHQDRDRSDVHKILDTFSTACMLETAERLRTVQPTRHHLSHYSTWLGGISADINAGHYSGLSKEDDLNQSSSSLRETIETLYTHLKGTDAQAAATAVYRITNSCETIFSGETDELELLLEDDVLHRLYDFMQNSEYSAFLDLVAHQKPNLKVLEIGAGTGGTTATVLPTMQSAYGERMYLSYTYTDVSSGFFPAAKERFKDHAGVDYAILDISKDPLEQGFEPESFDLIIACNVLHATPNIHETLTHVRKLLHPRGRLFLQELSPETKWINFVMGVLPGWWLGADDLRFPEPYINSKRWDEELRRAGFADTAVAYDGYLNNNIVSMPAETSPRPKRVTLLQPPGTPLPSVEKLGNSLQDSGYHVDRYTLGSSLLLPRSQDVLAALDLAGPFFHELDEHQFANFQDFIRQAKDAQCGVLWVTAASQAGCLDPRYAPVIGVSRVLRTEMSLDFATLELGDLSHTDFSVVPTVLAEFQRRIVEPDVSPDAEWAHVDGKTLIGRYHFIDVVEELKVGGGENPVRKLEQHRPGLANTLFWKPMPQRELADDEVRIDVRAVGLNFKDVLICLGVITEPSSIGRGMGYECSGEVITVGSGVTKHRIGDRVIASSSGSFTTSHYVSEQLCAKLPDAMSFEDGATLPAVYCTAIYCLLDTGRLKKGMSVLIHSAAGGVGIAAIQIAKMVSAEIYCTVSSEEKIQYLMTQFDIPRDHIYNSRDTSFLPAVLEKTGGRGVDVVLNSLSGELLHTSWKCVAEFGTFVEIGRRDFIGQGTLAMELFESNRSFVGFDLLLFSTERPQAIESLMNRAVQFYHQGHIKPIAPMKTFSATQISEPFRYMQKAQHIGKIVVTMPRERESLPSEAVHEELSLRGDRAYLFVGGLGGLGRSITTWLAEKGARHVVFLSRSAGNIGDEDPFVRELASVGCRTTRLSGDVSNYEDVIRAVKAVESPIAGVLQASMVLRDNSFVDMQWEQWVTASKPKIRGTWNLHNALMREQVEPLDFFFLFSSAGAMTGQWGQANYNAGNTFLDAFVSYRHSLGLPASTVNIGVIGDVGYVSENTDVLDSLRSTAQYIMKEPALLDSIELMLKRSTPRSSSPPAAQGRKRMYYVQKSQIGIGLRSVLPITAPANRTVWRKDPRMLVYRNLEATDTSSTSGSASDEELTQFLRGITSNMTLLKSADAAALLSREIGKTLLGFMMRSTDELNLDAPLATIGIDSLISIEVRNWIRRRLGAEVTVLEIVRAENLKHLGATVQEKLVEKYQERA
jgi:NADPH:quinone reductase-like Zn-dependent oxidoreductase/2-polyprenyl-3-methyl-5-hydroxy-6-metoxy-1,4-benzoquinol methylase